MKYLVFILFLISYTTSAQTFSAKKILNAVEKEDKDCFSKYICSNNYTEGSYILACGDGFSAAILNFPLKNLTDTLTKPCIFTEEVSGNPFQCIFSWTDTTQHYKQFLNLFLKEGFKITEINNLNTTVYKSPKYPKLFLTTNYYFDSEAMVFNIKISKTAPRKAKEESE